MVNCLKSGSNIVKYTFKVLNYIFFVTINAIAYKLYVMCMCVHACTCVMHK